MAYVYRHIRLDKNIPFYIGIGSDDDYRRAYSKMGRSPFWKRIAAKTEYFVEILFDEISWEDACKKEIEFISLYKRRIDGGVLCNITLGGDGKLGVKPANAYEKGHVPFTKGKPMPQHVKEAIRKAVVGKPNWARGTKKSAESIEKQMKTKRERDVIYRGERHPRFGVTHTDELKARWSIIRKGVEPWNKGKKWSPEEITEKMKETNANQRMAINQYTLEGEFVQSFVSIAEAAKKTGVGKGCISLCCQNKRRMTGGFKWKLKEG